jgi:hypothetical protein
VLGEDGVFVCDAGVEERRCWDGGGGHVGDEMAAFDLGSEDCCSLLLCVAC